jgi:hypothetical protein
MLTRENLGKMLEVLSTKNLRHREEYGEAFANFYVVSLKSKMRNRSALDLEMRNVELPEEWESLRDGKFRWFDDELKSVKSFVGKMINVGKRSIPDSIIKNRLNYKIRVALLREEYKKAGEMAAYMSLLEGNSLENLVKEIILKVDSQDLKYALTGIEGVYDVDFNNPITWIGFLRGD